MYASEQKPRSDKTPSYHSKEYIDILMLQILANQSIQVTVTWLKQSQVIFVHAAFLLLHKAQYEEPTDFLVSN